MNRSLQITDFNCNIYNHTHKNLLVKVTEYLFKLGFQANLKGFSYTREAIILCIESHIINISAKKIYDKIAKKHNVKPTSVERAIRYAIEGSWNRGSFEWKIYLPTYTYCPANSEFIAESAELIMIN